MDHRNNQHKLFIFFGADVEAHGRKCLEESLSRGYTLLPLDSPAVGIVSEKRLPFVLIDEYLGLDALVRIRRQAVEYEWNWFKAAESEFTSDGICWPDFDIEAIRWFWRDAVATLELGQAFQERGGSKIKFFYNKPLRPSIFYYRSDIHAVLLNELFPDEAFPIALSDASGRKQADYFSKTRITFYDPSGRPLYNPDVLRDKIVLAFNPGESYRFGHVIEQLNSECPGEVATALIYSNCACAKELTQKYSIPAVSPRQLDFEPSEYQDGFMSGYNKLAENTSGRLGWIISALRYNFENFCKYRWPTLASNFHAWLDLYRQIRPKAIIVSALWDSESRLPAQAATCYDIPTFSIPHGAGFTGNIASKIASKYVLYSLGHQKIYFGKNGLTRDRLIACQSLSTTNEHPVIHRESFVENDKLRILALTNPTKCNDLINPDIELRKQLEALQILDNPPAGIADHISLQLKVHPSFSEIELISSISPSLTKKILPPDTELRSVVEQADLIVAVNYFGGALVEAMRSAKPVLFLTTDRLTGAIKDVDPVYNTELLSSTFGAVSTEKEFWDSVRRFATDGKTAQQMHLQSRQFYKDNMDDSGYPTIGRVIKNVLSQDKVSQSEETKPPVNESSPAVRECKMEQLLPDHKTIPVDLLNYKFQSGADGDGSTPPHELEAICKIVRSQQPRTIFEFGTYEGDTTLRLAVNSHAEIYTSDLPPEEYKDHAGSSPDYHDLDIYPDTPGIKFLNTPWANRIHQILADTQTYDFSRFYGKFDLVFVDACHHYEFALHDSINALKMIRPGGVIIWHDYESYAPGVMKALNEIGHKFPIYHIEGTSLAVYCCQQALKSEDIDGIFSHKEKPNQPKTAACREENKINCSVIIPTFNRSDYLKNTINSIVNQDFPKDNYEILVVDNGSTDSTRKVAEAAIAANRGYNIRYIFEPEPGLLSGRHRGALEAKGDILVFIDDDIKAVEGWLSAIAGVFDDQAVHLVGGASLPEFEADPPRWMLNYWHKEPGRIACGSLSLAVLKTDVEVEIDAHHVWGLNFSIRKRTLFELGGFHPDCIPKALQHFQGDGETGLASKLKAKGYKAIYAPGATVYHYIPKERMTVDYFKRRFFYQGVCDSFTEIRKNNGLKNAKVPAYKPEHPNLRNLPPEQQRQQVIYREIENERINGIRFHLESVVRSPELLEWVLRKDYFDYKLPDLPTVPTGEAYNLVGQGR